MPRIRKLKPGGEFHKLGECFKVLLSGASGECFAGELGCCGDSCCSSAVVSRALAEYCQHSDAAREAFVAAKGIDALQVALARGSPSVATAAARVLGALCGSPHGLRCVLRWSSGSGADLLSTLAAVAGRSGLPPDLRSECVDALRSALGSLHGPAAGGGLELAGALREVGADVSCVYGGGLVSSTDFLTRVALPPLLSANMHLRAAAAKLIAAAAEEGLLPGSGGTGHAAATATTLAMALDLNRRDGVRESHAAATLAVPESAADGGGRKDLTAAPAGARVLALSELVAALLGSPSGAELLVAMRAPTHVLALCREAVASADDSREQEGEWLDGCGGGGSAVREALVDAVLLLARSEPSRLWPSVEEACRESRQAFAAGAAELANRMLTGTETAHARAAAASAATAAGIASFKGHGGVSGGGGRDLVYSQGAFAPPRCTAANTAAALASALASWPQEVLACPAVERAVSALLLRLNEAAMALMRSCEGASVSPAHGDHSQQRAEKWQQRPAAVAAVAETIGTDWDHDWQQAPPPATCSGLRSNSGVGLGSGAAGFGWPAGKHLLETSRLRTAAAAAAAAIRLYGAIATDGIAASSTAGADAAGAALTQCVLRLLELVRNGRTALAELARPLEALSELHTGALKSLGAMSTAVYKVAHPGGGSGGEGFIMLRMLGLTAARLVEASLMRSGGTPSLQDASPGESRALAGRSGARYRLDAINGRTVSGRASRGEVLYGTGQMSSEDGMALVAALRLWARVMELLPACACKQHAGEARDPECTAVCDACAVRPMGALTKVATVAERLAPGPSDRDVTDFACDRTAFLSPNAQERFEVGRMSSGCPAATQGIDVTQEASFPSEAAGFEASTSAGLISPHAWRHNEGAPLTADCSVESEGDRNRLGLMQALLLTLEAAGSNGSEQQLVHLKAAQVSERWKQFHALMGRLRSCISYCEAVERKNRLLDAGRLHSGVDTGNDVLPDSLCDTDSAAELADAEIILDECLACISATVAVP